MPFGTGVPFPTLILPRDTETRGTQYYRGLLLDAKNRVVAEYAATLKVKRSYSGRHDIKVRESASRQCVVRERNQMTTLPRSARLGVHDGEEPCG